MWSKSSVWVDRVSAEMSGYNMARNPGLLHKRMSGVFPNFTMLILYCISKHVAVTAQVKLDYTKS